jgi:hypothetical protein
VNVGNTSPPYSATAAVQAGMNLAIGVDSSQLTLTPPTQSSVPVNGVLYMTATGTYQFQSITPFVSVLLKPPSGGPIAISVTTTTPVG